MPGPEGTMVTKIPKIHALLGLESKGAVGKRTNKCLGEQVREKIKHESGVAGNGPRGLSGEVAFELRCE